MGTSQFPVCLDLFFLVLLYVFVAKHDDAKV